MHADGKMRMVRNSSRYGIDLFFHLVEHLAEVMETRDTGVFLKKVLCMFVANLGIAKCDKVEHARFHELFNNSAASVTDAAAREIDALIRFDFCGIGDIGKSREC